VGKDLKSKEKTLFNIIRNITSPIFEKHGFHMIKIIEDWQQITPNSWHNQTYPLRITWNNSDQGILLVGVDNNLILNLLQYDEEKVIEKLNQYFGYSCIIKISFKTLSK